MKLAISNIAWPPSENLQVYALMREHGATGLEIAPGLAFPAEADPFDPSLEAVQALTRYLDEFGIQLVSMQSLLFGRTGAQLFGSEAELQTFERSLESAIRLGERLGIPNLVFGSPANRRHPKVMTPSDAADHAREVFLKLADLAFACGTRIAIEPNPAEYGTNFLTSVEEAAQFVLKCDHPCIALNFDLGALYMNGEEANVGDLAGLSRGRVSHIHLSEPQLAPAPADTERTRNVIRSLTRRGYEGWFSIEMRQPPTDGMSVLADCLTKAASTLAGLKGSP